MFAQALSWRPNCALGPPGKFLHGQLHSSKPYKLLFIDVPYYGQMLVRSAVIAVVALATFDLYFFDDKYINAVQATATALLHHVFGF